MATFEKQFENLDVQTAVMDDAMNKQAALSTPANEVDTLLQAIADEHNLDMKITMPQAGTSAVAAPAAAVAADEDSLSAALRQLKS